MLDLTRERRRMVDIHLSRRGIHDREILQAMREVPREAFVDPGFEEFAYEDGPLPIANGQTISQPYIVAFMLEMAAVGPGDQVLEVGTGSGYAAAVMSRIVDHVYTIERHAGLAESATQRFQKLGYRNIEVRTGDGTKGWPEAAPFDAIIVAASGPGAPLALQQQLDVGGRLVIPVGDDPYEQRLLKVTRTGASTYSEEDFGAVRFVPLIGEQGWREDRVKGASRVAPHPRTRSLPEMIAAAAEPLPDFDDPAFAEPFDRFAERRIVLLGEASHGTSEFYRARAAITSRLIEKHGFTIVAAEADWPDAAAVDRYVRHRPPSPTAGRPFQRFPTWMWRNTDVAAFVAWLRGHNETVGTPTRQAGFYGLDIYNMSGSIAAVLDYLDRVDPEAARIARERYGCLTPWQTEPSTYGRAALTRGYRQCEEAVLQQCRDMLARQLDDAGMDGAELFDAAQNARLVASAERYYRAMYYGGSQSWNLRDTHMFETLEHILEAHGPEAKAVVWAHNSHIGDARYTEMGISRDEVNIGQLCRERFGSAAALIGFGTHTGTVAAAKDWDGDMDVMSVRPSRDDSYERLCHDAAVPRFLLDLGRDVSLFDRLTERRLERFIGVIYRPESELHSHYADASLARQFDAFVWFDETRAVTPLGPEHAASGLPETYPFGL
ncbi:MULTISPECIES: protein-L-isoaspartate(D-aspartate) O-methyltransferase [unclassified Mesorhizobium]|uniref:protein-L-isoaspartate(D-aspartate) O-methyltransferase n=1 Tax=unclassified Mesorhizobium TaxID=325217 RepID=UPI000BB063B4|nr:MULTISPECIES: protein-L-isoaspartate(D-aspartate) O-methyltransferase [unclassified Mesorhizobium]TGT58609.1 protein-L-isoaspartate(D-aspartate) O-methyltransferase [Mesorhizobium sp. M00.F.Ca.ET.170.01.1.1]AZO12075.1 protein-L-isoaspartate(D-aspartate) O-methyltransferase [Mesorhizobium sp. M3A.F.Ca.ET.080.04.2.1]PBB84367.1 protein-L-isoaspartate O-methyltransferase [Mesorhizobium sp. WSM3876]RWB74793.1 MAG: protein-L-isoaspartate(D-aspartate) O-methyltransferase [Mesorhizobium sp.]RWB8974